MKYRIAIVFALFTHTLFAQQVVFDKEINFHGGVASNTRETYPVVNPIDGSVALFVTDQTGVDILLFDSTMTMQKQLFGKAPERKYSQLLGNQIGSDNVHYLFFSNTGHSEFATLTSNFQAGFISNTILDLNIKKEVYVGALTLENKFYLLTVLKGTSILKMYSFENGLKPTENLFDFKDEKFSAESFPQLSYALKEHEPQIINNSIPNPIDLTHKRSKLYYYDKKIVLTLDNVLRHTAVITIDLASKTSALQFIKTTKLQANLNSFFNSNSFVYENKLYQLKLNSEIMSFAITDLTSAEKANEFIITEDEPLALANTPVVQIKESGYDRELQKTKQFLRKVNQSFPGISAYRVNDEVVVTLGGYVEAAPTGGILLFSGLGGMPGYISYYVMFSSANSKSVYFKSKLDPQTFTHKPGEIAPNIFEIIQTHAKLFGDEKSDFFNRKEITAKTIFSCGGKYFLGFYLIKEKQFKLLTFSEN